MQKRDLLPAIVFVFSRKGCDAAAEEVGEQRVSLVSADEKARIMDKLKTFSGALVGAVQAFRL
jgi:superfamily II RNA helicase